MTSPDIQIEVNALAKRFNRDWIFRDLSFTFEPAKTYAVTGPNGSGKSTLLQVLWGQMPPSSGTLTYRNGTSTIPPEEIYRRTAVATPYMDLIDEFTLAEQVTFHFRMRKLRAGIAVSDVIERMGLTASAGKQIGNFSSGMRQRVKLGLAFMTEASLIFLDEPGTNLDRNAFQWYLAALAEIQGKSTVFIASNDPAEFATSNVSISILDFKRSKANRS